MALYLIVVQAHFIMNNVFEGMIWFFLPVSLVICNDIFAYICGITFGRTQLIKLSPKKTVEGFVGAWILTVIFGVGMTNVLMRYKYFICPVNVSCVFNQNRMQQLTLYRILVPTSGLVLSALQTQFSCLIPINFLSGFLFGNPSPWHQCRDTSLSLVPLHPSLHHLADSLLLGSKGLSKLRISVTRYLDTVELLIAWIVNLSWVSSPTSIFTASLLSTKSHLGVSLKR